MAKERQIIMLVDDNAASLTMGKNILKEKYDVYPVGSGEKLLELLEKITPDLILLDIAMPEMDGYEVIRRLKASRKTEDIPVIFLTSRDDPGNELEGLSLGAIDYISKPFSPALLIQRIENHLLLNFREKEMEKYNQQLQEMAQKSSGEDSELIITILGVLADILEFRDEQSAPGHARRIRSYLKILLEALAAKNQYQEEAGSLDLQLLLPASQLHDLGKSIVNEAILNKKEKLSESEFEEIKKHPASGVEIINQISTEVKDQNFLDYAKTIVSTHHERWDGKGYPQGLKETNIPLLGRLMALADGYDALVSPRPHRKAYSTEEAEKIILEGKGTWLDPVLADIFKEEAARFAEVAKKA
jgi:putative two-component system response regulator